MQRVSQARQAVPLIILIAVAIVVSVVFLFFAARQSASQDVKPGLQVQQGR